jgi:glutamine synthetase
MREKVKMNRKIQLEYIWLDGYENKNLRSKIKFVHKQELKFCDNESLRLTSVPIWNFDGSSTKQAPGNESECLLMPERLYKISDEAYYVLCEVCAPDLKPHASNTRHALREVVRQDNSNFWWGFEQEYFLKGAHDLPVGFPPNGFPKPQGEYYCGVGNSNVKYRMFAREHASMCMEIGIDLTGINAEVAIGQWEYQCFAKDTLKACDDLWVSRYLLHQISEDFELSIDLSPKPVKGDWNGSGCHTNFSNDIMRRDNNKSYYMDIMKKLDDNHFKHISAYGKNNEQRLTGEHETQHISKFTYGIGDRGASIRIPSDTVKNNWNGYLEDRRPASNCDPYEVAKEIISTVVLGGR